MRDSLEAVESFVGSKGDLLEKFRYGLGGRGAALHAAAIYDKGAPLYNCVAFIDSTKIQMSQPGGDGANQRA